MVKQLSLILLLAAPLTVTGRQAPLIISLSPNSDDTAMAFSGDRYGNHDIFTVAVTGGTPNKYRSSAREVPWRYYLEISDHTHEGL